MRLYVPALLAAIVCVQAAAQTMVVHKSDGTTERIAVADIARITFDLNDGPVRTAGPEGVKKIRAAFAKLFPNPFGTRLSYTLNQPADVVVSVYDASGKLVTVLVNTRKPAGTHEVHMENAGLGSGTYIVNVKAGRNTTSTNLVVFK